jgi:hypothetical protein
MPNYPKPLDEGQQQVAEMVAAQAQAMGVPVDLALAMAYQESRFRHSDDKGRITKSPKGAIGLMQVTPDTARQYKFDLSDLRDPQKNVNAGLTILKDLLDKSNGVGEIAAAKYNGGPNRKFFETGEGSLPDETVDYVDQITKMGGFSGQLSGDRGPAPDKKFVDVPPAPKPGEAAPATTSDGTEVEPTPGLGIPKAKIYAQDTSNPQQDFETNRQLATGAGALVGAGVGAAKSRANAAVARIEREEMARLRAQQQMAKLNPKPPVPTAPAAPAAGALPAAQGSPQLKGAQKYVQSLGNQVPYAIAEQAETMDKVRATGGQNLINKDAEAMAKIREMGEGRMRLVGEGRGQFMLPPDVASQAAQQQAQAAANEERLARIAADTDQARQIRLQQEEANRPMNRARAALSSLSDTKVGRMGGRAAQAMFRYAPVIGYGMAGASLGKSASEIDEAMRQKEYIDAILAAAQMATTGASMVPPLAPIAVPADMALGAARAAREYYR